MPNNKQAARQTRRDQTKRTRQIIGTTLGLLFVVFLGYVTWQQSAAPDALPADAVADPMLGSATGRVEIVEYGDFGCPACRAWHTSGVREQVLAAYGDQVRFVWRDFPVITAQSPLAAEAGQCASAQGRFWAFHDQLYDHFAGLATEQLAVYACDAGLDQAEFSRCLDEGRMRAKVQANEQEGRRLGVRGTPGFSINGRLLPRPPDFAMLEALIQTELGR